jgi:peptide/nickel transport system ATP-binding protein
VHAVDEVTFALRPGTITALVGESGSGKSTVARLLARLHEPTAGTVLFDGRDVSRERRRGDLLRYRAQVQMIFQDPFGSLNPVKTIRYHLTRPLRIHKAVPSERIDARLHELLETVGLMPPDKYLEKYPHQLSGGQRQRVVLAIAMANNPALLICDEPTTALDVSVQARVLELIDARAREMGSALLFISHDLAVVASVCDELLVMWQGRIVERGSVTQVLSDPQHQHTRRLLADADLTLDEPAAPAAGGAP